MGTATSRRKKVPRGAVVAIGGAEDRIRSRLVLCRVLELAGGKEARIAVIPTASRLADTGDIYREQFLDLGADRVDVLPFDERSDGASEVLIRHLEGATGIFLTGGNQLRLTSILGGTQALKTIRRRYVDGAVVAGTSAGAAVLCEHMIAFGESGSTPRAGMVTLAPGFGLVNSVIIDQHFRKRDRLGRLLTAMAYNPYEVGLGLDEDTAAVIRNHDIVVIGSGAVTVVDASELEYSEMGLSNPGAPVSLIGLRLHVLAAGGRFDMDTRVASAPALGADEAALTMGAESVEGSLPCEAEETIDTHLTVEVSEG